ncbi:MAG: CxxxxCH/CxxCH domain-containing protein [Anaeromyxobacter sp.]|nr:CxxxxCH/CxxCH domain-containing protein [Anaeromyxobacter sp.]
MRQHLLAASVVVALAAALSGCDQARQVTAPATGSTSCTGCHGDVDGDSGAPPRDVAGATSTEAVTVGAHTAHLAAGVDCAACHVVPARIADAGHIDAGATPKVKFSGKATLDGAAPTWSRTGGGGKGTCSNVYCHGGTLRLGSRGEGVTPTWAGNPPALVGGPCGACHGTAATNGAPAGHGAGLAQADCATCHPDSTLADGSLKPASDGGLHLDGEVQYSAAACAGCHGDPDRAERETLAKAAPPADASGALTGAKVGAHLRHVSSVTGLGSRLSAPFTCAECHAVPTAVPHPAGAPVQFGTATGTLARGPAGTLSPSYGAAGGTCSSTYCHGAGLLGGSNKTPAWTGTATCGTCHFLASPPAPHPATDRAGLVINVATQCIQCHPGTVLATGGINVANGLHVNGVKDVDYHAPGFAAAAAHGGPAKQDLDACRACHGATLDGGPASNGVSCNQCHGGTAWQQRCTLCHGEANRAAVAGQPDVGQPPVNAALAAPPLGSQDESATGSHAVGAHLAHVAPGPLARAFTCQQCHGSPLPTDLGHLDGLVRIGWQLAATGGSTPAPAAGAYPRTPAAASPITCANYCHGATLGGGTRKATDGSALPVAWTGGASEAACGTCHGLPPAYAAPAWHAVSSSGCATCHGYDASAIDTARHVDGTLDLVAGLDCFACHGTRAAGNNAPPRAASSAAVATTDPRVGAHQAHVRAGALAGAFACTACHGTLPIAPDHADGAVTLIWGALATSGGTPATPAAGGVTPGTTATCANYCHGGRWAAPGPANDQYRGGNTSPDWTAGPAEVSCGSCHLVAPTSPAHASVTATKNCGQCHTGYDCTTGNLAACTVNVTAHVNGATDAGGQTCASCHGSAANFAPPLASNGATTGVKVGAHQRHLTGTTLRAAAIGCTECHAVPTAMNHLDGTTGVTWGALATTGGVLPTPAAINAAWEAAPTCTNYCHGGEWASNAAYRGATTAPGWLGSAADVACNDCHQAPPTSPAHTAVTATTSCATCHPGYVCTSGNLAACTVDKAVHLNGVADVTPLSCATCHGTAGRAATAGSFGPANSSANLAAVPPLDTLGASGGVRVGPHLSHSLPQVPASQIYKPILCSECHGLAVNGYTTTHSNLASDVTFASATGANLGGVTPAIVQGTAPTADTCTTYCHGASLTAAQRGSVATWSWTSTGAATCGSCHASPPADQFHTRLAKPSAATTCSACHASVVNATGGIVFTGTGAAATTLHLNGIRQASSATCTSCHGTPGGSAAPPTASNGNTLTTQPKVGAHQVHLTGLRLRSAAIGCAECHVVPTAQNHADATTTVAWGALSSTGGLVPTPAAITAAWETTPTCTNYCHGGTWAANAAYRGTTTAPSWTGTAAQVACNACHLAPPTSPAHSGVTATTSCATCHPGYDCTSGNLAACTVNKALHIGGSLDVTLDCTSCHGTAGRLAAVGMLGPVESATRLAAAPPRDAAGAATSNKVGPHQGHVNPGATQALVPLLCAECHGAAVNGYTTTHSNLASDVTFAAATRSNLGGVSSAWTPGAPGGCTSYCHGTSFTAAQRGSVTAWRWDTITAAGCGSCHASPPADPAHTSLAKPSAATTCSACHAATVSAGGAILFSGVGAAATTVHIDGTRQTSATCTSCHGTAGVNAAPPSLANAANTNGVGAHQAHVATGAMTTRSVAFACTECHPNQTSMAHANGGAPEVSFAAGLSGVATTWSNTASSCATSACHGGAASQAQWGGTLPTPIWTDAGETFRGCTACHGSPPPLNAATHHPPNPTCAACHPAGATATAMTGAAAAAHVDGTTNRTRTGCTECHGDLTATGVGNADGRAAPGFNAAAASVRGATAATAPAVGAHGRHLTGTTLRTAAIACTECHLVPAAGNLAHATGAGSGGAFATVTFGALSGTGGLVPAYAGSTSATTNASAGSCASTYCHGGRWAPAGATNDQYRGSLPAPSWTGGTAASACGACHRVAPTSTAHAAVTGATNCGNCHPGYDCTTGNLAACTVNRTSHLNGAADAGTLTCASCHGTAGRTATVGTLGASESANNLLAAPPTDTQAATTGVRVGPHQAHSVPAAPGAQIFRPVACSECHGVAVNAYTTAHPNAVTNLTFASATAANLGGVVPSLVQNTAPTADTCTTYCHGASLTAAQRGTTTTWQWNTGLTVDCGSCHGSPPGDAFHTRLAKPSPATACTTCHATVVNAAGGIVFSGVGAAATTLHINGVRQASSATCTSCHGTAAAGNAAPPVSTTGAATGVRVGAHQRHLTGTSLRAAAIGCADCHTVPTAMNHASGTTSVTWGTLASTSSVVPTPATIDAAWEATPTCTNYCHGGKWAANATYRGVTTAPSWLGTTADVACNDCHLAPPTSPAHATVTATTSCANCHPGYTCTSGNLAACSVNLSVHLNGVYDAAAQTCASCHGTAGRVAVGGTFGPANSANNLIAVPPLDTLGAASGVRVGPHLSHSVPQAPASQVFRPILCSECHGTAVNTYGTAHSNLVTNLTFANATNANLGGVTPTLVQNTAPTADTCTTYCHGASLTAAQRGSVATWSWTSAGAADCGSCHASPPADQFHTRLAKPSAATTCSACHLSVVNAAGGIVFTGSGAVAATLHINGVRQASSATCTSCHGTAAAGNFAPPAATTGATLTTDPKVGAHQRHLTSVRLRGTAIACADCHTVPSAVNHATGTATVTWGALARTGGLVPTPATITAAWETTPTCTNYCHGQEWAANATYRGVVTAPSWTGTAAQVACNSCHLAPPTSAIHPVPYPTTTNCSSCHAGYNCVTSNLAACTVNLTTHLNGVPDSSGGTCSSCHGTAGRVSVTGTFGPVNTANNLLAVPPNDTAAAATGVRVGPHLSHAVPQVPAQQIYKPVLCSECHGVAVNTYTSGHTNSATDLTFANATAANLGGIIPGIVQNTAPTADTCTTYCHGASFTVAQQGVTTTWSWNTGVAVACNSCHASPRPTRSTPRCRSPRRRRSAWPATPRW